MAASPKPFTPKAQEEHKTAQLHMRRFWELRQKLPPARVQGHVLRSGHVIARGRDSSWPSAGWTSVALLLLSKSRSSASQHHLACLGCGTKTLSRLLVLQCRCHTLLDTMHKCFCSMVYLAGYLATYHQTKSSTTCQPGSIEACSDHPQIRTTTTTTTYCCCYCFCYHR